MHRCNKVAELIKKKVVITGGSSGIGKALVERFARSGCEVWFSYCRGKARAEALCQSLQSYPVVSVYFDQGDYDSCQAFCEHIPAEIDVLVINGGLGTKTVENYSSDPQIQDELFLKVNALGPLWLCREIVPKMEMRDSGKVILVSSVGGGVAPFPEFRFAEQMSKSALAYMGRQYAAILAGTGVDIFTICPGATDTPMFQASTMNHLEDSERDSFLERLPGKRLIEAEEIAELCLFLCSPAGQVLRGTVLDASLGLGGVPWMIKKQRLPSKCYQNG